MALLSDRLGLLLQFAAFWLIAPELLGATRLHSLRKFVTSAFEALLVAPIGGGIAVLFSALLLRYLDKDLHSAIKAGIIGLVLLSAALVGYSVLRRKRLARLVERLGDDEQFRSALASVGAALFTLGFVLQFAATFGKT